VPRIVEDFESLCWKILFGWIQLVIKIPEVRDGNMSGPARAGSENQSPAHPAQFFGKKFFSFCNWALSPAENRARPQLFLVLKILRFWSNFGQLIFDKNVHIIIIPMTRSWATYPLTLSVHFMHIFIFRWESQLEVTFWKYRIIISWLRWFFW